MRRKIVVMLEGRLIIRPITWEDVDEKMLLIRMTVESWW